jgi:hypothetical protein
MEGIMIANADPPSSEGKVIVVGDDYIKALDESVDIEEAIPEEAKKEPKEVPLPDIGDTFMLKGHEYRVVYINEGQRRFSCIPMKGVY